MAWSEEVVEAALQAAVVTGSAAEASKALAEHTKIEVPERTIQSWIRDVHRDRWLEIREEVGPQIRELIAAQSEDLAQRIGDVESKTLDHLEAKIDEMSGKDAALALKALADAKAKAIDKALVLRGEPNQITAYQDPGELYRELAALGARVTVAGKVIEGTARPTHRPELEVQT